MRLKPRFRPKTQKIDDVGYSQTLIKIFKKIKKKTDGKKKFKSKNFPNSKSFGADKVPRSKSFGAGAVSKSKSFGADKVRRSKRFGAGTVSKSKSFGAEKVPRSKSFGEDKFPRSKSFGAGTVSKTKSFGADKVWRSKIFRAGTVSKSKSFRADKVPRSKSFGPNNFEMILCQKLFFWHKTSNSSKKFYNHNKRTKNIYIRSYSNWLIRKNTGGKFCRVVPTDWMALHPVLSYRTTFYEPKVDNLLVANFFMKKQMKNLSENLNL